MRFLLWHSRLPQQHILHPLPTLSMLGYALAHTPATPDSYLLMSPLLYPEPCALKSLAFDSRWAFSLSHRWHFFFQLPHSQLLKCLYFVLPCFMFSNILSASYTSLWDRSFVSPCHHMCMKCPGPAFSLAVQKPASRIREPCFPDHLWLLSPASC